jgi:hypothetical protein
VLSNSYVQVPDPEKAKSLDLTGRYLYLEYLELAHEFFVVHVDIKIAGREPLVRLTLSNMEPSSQPGGNTIKLWAPRREADRWTVLCVDLQDTLQASPIFTKGAVASFEKCHLVKSVQVCANLSIRGVYTSDNVYDWVTLPREMSFKQPKYGRLETNYQFRYLPEHLEPAPKKAPPLPIDISGAKPSQREGDSPSSKSKETPPQPS